MKLTKLAGEDSDYVLYVNSDGQYILTVFCGMTGVYFLNIPITDKAAKKCLADIHYLKSLARKISQNANRYGEQNVVIPDADRIW